MVMTVSEIMKKTGQKRGTVENFRSKLQEYELIVNNELLGEREVNTFEKAVAHKDEKITWVDAFEWAIQNEYAMEMKLKFFWAPETMIRNLIWLINKEKVTYMDVCDSDNEEGFHAVFDIMIDNFKYISGNSSTFKGSWGTDGNGALTSAWVGDDYIYYIVGKYNHITKNEDIHIFYNEGTEFNIMRCKYICGGKCKDNMLYELWRTAVQKIPHIPKRTNNEDDELERLFQKE
ncbi:MAG: hypothetical protein E7211_20660 [Clostridium lundense]|nr:hypothetical protein [Clostridium lundense]